MKRKEQKSANKERIRLLQDLNDTLFNAAASNDVVAFLNAQRQGKKDLDRLELPRPKGRHPELLL